MHAKFTIQNAQTLDPIPDIDDKSHALSMESPTPRSSTLSGEPFARMSPNSYWPSPKPNLPKEVWGDLQTKSRFVFRCFLEDGGFRQACGN